MPVNESRLRTRLNKMRIADRTQHPNLLLTLERVKIEEAAIQAEYTRYASLVGVIVAVVGFVVTGAFSALDKLTWGLAQRSPSDCVSLFLPNAFGMALGVGLGIRGVYLLSSGYIKVVLVAPWKEYKDDVLKATEESADQVLYNLIQDIMSANSVNTETLELCRKAFFSATKCLFIATLILLAVGGYNTTAMSYRGSQDKGKE